MKSFLMLVLTFAVSNCPAQYVPKRSIPEVVYDSTYAMKLNPSSPIYHINFHAEYGRTPYGEPACLFSITTYNPTDSKPIDTLHYYTKAFTGDRLRAILESSDEAKPQFLDVNFDGYLDIRIPSGESVKEDLEYDYFLFEPTERKFRFSEEFTDICQGAEFDSAAKQISLTTSTHEDCSYCWERRTYKIEMNHPVLSEVVTSELVTESGAEKWKITTKTRTKGVMVVSKVEYPEMRH